MITLYSHSYRTIQLLTALLLSLGTYASISDATAAPSTQELAPTEASSTVNTDADDKENTAVTTSTNTGNNFTLKSLNNTKIGDFFDERTLSKYGSEVKGCFTAKNKALTDVNYLVIDDTVAKITSADPRIPSVYGIKVGDNISKIYDEHKDEMPEIADSPLSNPGENTLIMYYWYTEGGQPLGIRYDIYDDVVSSISIGTTEALKIYKGCA